MLDAAYYAALGISSIHEKVLTGRRLSFDDGLALFNCPDITAVGALALHARCRLHGHKAFYVVNRQINYTNVCVNGCTFCAFRRDAESEPGAFALSKEDILDRLKNAGPEFAAFGRAAHCGRLSPRLAPRLVRGRAAGGAGRQP